MKLNEFERSMNITISKIMEIIKKMINIGFFIFGVRSSTPIYVADIITGANHI